MPTPTRRRARPSLLRLEDRATPSTGFGFAGGFGDAGYDEGRAVATDAADNLYVTGTFSGTADFDPGPGTFNLTSAGGSYDAFVSRIAVRADLVARTSGGEWWLGANSGSSFAFSRYGQWNEAADWRDVNPHRP
jgi:hypothetical protein